MNRDELATRSEGALEVLEIALIDSRRIEKLLREPDWIHRLRAKPTVLEHQVEREHELATAIASVARLDPAAPQPLKNAHGRLVKVLIRRLRELGVEPTSQTVQDLIAQLLARALDMTREKERLQRAWDAIHKQHETVSMVGLGLIVSGFAGCLWLYLGQATPFWVACLTIGAGVLAAFAVAARPLICPACGHRFRNVTCGNCGQTQPPPSA